MTKVTASIIALAACAYCVLSPIPISAQQPAVVVPRLDNGKLALQEDPREWMRSDDRYSAELIQELYPYSEREAVQWSRLQSGVTQFREGDPRKALATWHAIVSAAPDSEVAVAALWNTGQIQHHSGKLTHAIASYKRALAASVESGSKHRVAIKKHYIAIDLSHAHLQLQQLAEAIDAARLAKTKYPPDSFCRISHVSEQQRISKYIETVQRALSQKQTVRLQTRAEREAAWDAAAGN